MPLTKRPGGGYFQSVETRAKAPGIGVEGACSLIPGKVTAACDGILWND